MKAKFWISVTVILAGILILLIPDNGKRLFSFNKDHGPSFQDFFGLLLIINGWIYWVMNIVKQWAMIYKKIRFTGMIIIILLASAGLLFIIAGLYEKSNPILYTGIGLSISAYIFPVVIAFRRY